MIALEELNFFWSSQEIEKVKQAYRNKLHISQIALNMRRPQEEVAILIMDLGRKGVL